VNTASRGLFVICLLGTAYLLWILLRDNFFPPELHLQALQRLPEPRPLIDVELEHADLGKGNLSALEGRWGLLYFGYRSCPDVCPLELHKLGQLLARFETEGKPLPYVLFVSVDPERDTPEALKAYAGYFHPGILGVTGRNRDLAQLANFFGAAYSRTVQIQGKTYLVEAGADMPAGSGAHYEVNHSSRVFVIDPAGRYIGSFAPPHDPEQWYGDMVAVMDYYQKTSRP